MAGEIIQEVGGRFRITVERRMACYKRVDGVILHANIMGSAPRRYL